jgi:hypothetical protein
MSPLQPPRPRGNRRTLIVGFDFGTHSTKVVVRERGRPEGRIAQFDAFSRNYPTSASPSVVRLIGDRLYFGTTALNASGGELYSALKVALLTNSSRRAGDVLDSIDLVTAYLAWSFQQVRNSLGDDKYANVFLNVAAPMSHVEDKELKKKYLRIVQAAWNLTFQAHETRIEQGISVSQIATLLRPLMNAPIQGTEVRRFDVLPETIAPIVSLSLDPLMKPSIYVIVDMGAGTTEVSVFHAGDPGPDQKILCYKDKTILVGALDLQSAEGASGLGGKDRVKEIINRIEVEYRGIWKSGYLVDAANPLSKRRWKDVIVVLSGGGTRHVAVDQRLRKSNPVPRWKGYETSFVVDRHVPGTLLLSKGLSKNDGSLFAVANGLAIERAKWPIVFEPHEIEPLTAPEPDKPRHDWSEDHRPPWV